MPATRFVPRPLASMVSAATLALSTGAIVSPVHAQESVALEEVVVTAQRREASLQDTALAIVALNETMIEQRGLSNTQDLIGELPGVNGFDAPGSKGAASINIRGVAGGSPANLSLDPAVAVYMDGVFLGKMLGSALDVAELERIEVLRGPQGTLYGRNSTGGAINFITRKPTGEFGIRATGTVGDYDLFGARVNVDLPAIGSVGEGLGQLAASFGYQTRERDPFFDNVDASKGGFQDIDRQAMRFALRWMPTDNLTADYVYDSSELSEFNQLNQVIGFNALDPAGNVSPILALQGTLQLAQGLSQIPGSDPRIGSRWIPSLQRTIAEYQGAEAQGRSRASRGGADFAPTTDTDIEGHALTLEWDLGDVTLRSLTSYREVDSYVFGDLENIDSSLDANGVGTYTDLVHLTLGQLYGASSGFPFPLVDNLWNAIDDIGAYHSKQDTQSNYEQASQEFNLIGGTDGLDYVVGLYWFSDDAEYRRNAIFAAPLSGQPITNYDMTTDSWAVFGQSTWTPDGGNSPFSFTLGLRYTSETKEADWDYPAYTTLFGSVPARVASDEEDFSNVTGEFTVAWRPTDNVNTFLRYSRGYRSGGFNGEIFGNSFDEETIDSFELGVKSDLAGGRLRLNGNLWTYTWKDVQTSQILTEGGVANSLITNAGEAERWGAELDGTWLATEDLILTLSYSHVSGDFEEFPDICGTNNPNNCLNGEDFATRAGMPDNMLSASADWTIAQTGLGELSLYMQVNWQDEWSESALWQAVVGGEPVAYDPIMMEERTLVNARLSLENIAVGNGSLRASLWGRNLLDEEYGTFGINYGGLNIISQQFGDPRMWGIDVTYEY